MSPLCLGSDLKSRLASVRLRLEKELAGSDPELLGKYPPESYIKRIDEYQHERTYEEFPGDVLAQCRDITHASGPAVLGTYHKLVLACLLLTAESRECPVSIPDSIRLLVLETFARIAAELPASHPNSYRLDREMFVMDLGYCRLRLLPCGSEHVDTWSGVPRRVLFKGGVQQFVKATVFFTARLQIFGRMQPYFNMHWDRRLIRQFTAEDYDRCYLRIADLLRVNPQMKGLVSPSWWYDPAAISISPELGFLRRVPEENGARFFHIGSNSKIVSLALGLSKERKELHAAGAYLPTQYLMVWPRKELLGWSDRVRSLVASSEGPAPAPFPG